MTYMEKIQKKKEEKKKLLGYESSDLFQMLPLGWDELALEVSVSFHWQ